MRSRRWAAAAVLVVALAAGGAANALDRSYLATGWQTVVRGEEGTDVTAASLQVHVHGATASPTFEYRDEVLASPGVWIAVDLSYATTDSWWMPEEVVLVDGDGREFSQPGGFGFTGTPWLAGPDIWIRGDLFFEVPAELVDDLTIEIQPERPTTLLPSTVIRVPLTIEQGTEPLVIDRGALLAEGER